MKFFLTGTVNIHYATIKSAYIIVFLIKVLVYCCLPGRAHVKCKSISESICVPSVVAPTVSAFLSRLTNSREAEVTGSKVNRGGGY